MRRSRLLLAFAAAGALLAACGSDSATTASPSASTAAPSAPTADATATTGAPSMGEATTVAPTGAAPTTAAPATFPVTVKAANGEVEIAAKPTRIVSLSPTATEMLFAIGAGPQVAAVDDQSSYPSEAPRTALSGFTPNVEAIAAEKPDLVVASNDTKDLFKGLGALKIPSLLLPAATTLDDTYAQLIALGSATGNTDKASEVVAGMKADIDAIVSKASKPAPPLRYYHELDPTLYTATSKTFIGSLYSLLGLQNVADPADKDGSGYPQLSAEFLVQANPDLVFLADTKCCQQDAKSAAARPGWSAISAVKKGNVVALDDDIASRWGPRVVDLLKAVSSAVEAASSGNGATSTTEG